MVDEGKIEKEGKEMTTEERIEKVQSLLKEEDELIEQGKRENDNEKIEKGKRNKYELAATIFETDWQPKWWVGIERIVEKFEEEKGDKEKQELRDLIVELANTFFYTKVAIHSEGEDLKYVSHIPFSGGELERLVDVYEAAQQVNNPEEFKEQFSVLGRLIHHDPDLFPTDAIRPYKLAKDKKGLLKVAEHLDRLNRPEQVKKAKDAIKEIEEQEEK